MTANADADAALREELETVKAALKEAELLADPTLFEQAQKLRTELAHARGGEARAQTQVQGLQDRVKDLESLVLEKEQKGIVASARWQLARDENDQVLAELQTTKRKQAEARADACAALATASALREDNRALRIQACEKALEEHKAKGHEQCLSQALRHALQQRDTLAARARALVRSVEEAVMAANKAQDDRNHLSTQLTAAREHAAGLTSELEKARKEIGDLEQQQPTIAQILAEHQRSITENIEAMMKRQQQQQQQHQQQVAAPPPERTTPAEYSVVRAQELADRDMSADQESVASSAVDATPERDQDRVLPASPPRDDETHSQDDRAAVEVQESPKAKKVAPKTRLNRSKALANPDSPSSKEVKRASRAAAKKPKQTINKDGALDESNEQERKSTIAGTRTPKKRGAQNDVARESETEETKEENVFQPSEAPASSKTPTPKEKRAPRKKVDAETAFPQTESRQKTPTPPKRTRHTSRATKLMDVEVSSDDEDSNSVHEASPSPIQSPTPIKKRPTRAATEKDDTDKESKNLLHAAEDDEDMLDNASATSTPILQRKLPKRETTKMDVAKKDQLEDDENDELMQSSPPLTRAAKKTPTPKKKTPTPKKKTGRGEASKLAAARIDEGDNEARESANTTSPTPKKMRPTRAAAKKAAMEIAEADAKEEESEDENLVATPARRRPARATRKKTAVADEDEDHASSSLASAPRADHSQLDKEDKEQEDEADNELLDEDFAAAPSPSPVPAKTRQTSRSRRLVQEDDSEDENEENVPTQRRQITKAAASKRTRANKTEAAKKPAARAKKRTRLNVGEHKALFNFMDSNLAPKLKAK